MRNFFFYQIEAKSIFSFIHLANTGKYQISYGLITCFHKSMQYHYQFHERKRKIDLLILLHI